MPTYEYACKSCDERLEVHQKFTDDALTECPACGGPLRKVFGNVGIAFKGSGFYKTDSRGTKSSSSTSSSTNGSSGDSSSKSDGGSSDSSTKSDSGSKSESAPKKSDSSSSTAAAS